jgi:hypothetical protein
MFSTSMSGFIALVVCLSVLIVGLCTAVYILLRDHSPTDEERAVRRQLSQRRRGQQQADSSSPFTYASSSAAPVTLTQKIGGMFGRGAATDENHAKNGGKGGRGWIRAGSGDDWETSADGESEMQKGSLSGPQTQRDAGEHHGIRLADRSIARGVDAPFHPPQPPYAQTNSTSSVFLENPYTPSSTPPPLRTPVTRFQTTDTLSPSSATSLASSSAARALSGSPEPYATGSVDEMHTPGDRHFSLQSGGSISTRTSHTGTKFIESLE